ncbi:MAG TPA: GDCCVxC domain-containing (seleno)protein [Burkholderiales bacterium]|nr:GDCCVxC domain-containing (seleno)protein [Burkholderiales bacterium]
MLVIQQRSKADVRSPVVNLQSTLICPRCGFEKQETMPAEACQFFYECTSCKTVLRPKPGDCCVYCSYGSTKCPSMQSPGETCCSS